MAEKIIALSSSTPTYPPTSQSRKSRATSLDILVEIFNKCLWKLISLRLREVKWLSQGRTVNNSIGERTRSLLCFFNSNSKAFSRPVCLCISILSKHSHWALLKDRLLNSVKALLGFPGGAVVKNPLTNAGDSGDSGSILGSERSAGKGNSNPFQYSCLGNPMDRGAWRAKSQTWLSTHVYERTERLYE